jgi:hypothetical protein
LRSYRVRLDEVLGGNGGSIPVVFYWAAVLGVHLRGFESRIHACQHQDESEEGGELHDGGLVSPVLLVGRLVILHMIRSRREEQRDECLRIPTSFV